MLTLTVPKPRWVKIPLADGECVDLQITPPTHRQIIQALMTEGGVDFVAARLACVTGWKDVVDDATPPQAIPFSDEAFATLIRFYPSIVSALLDEVRPMFQREVSPGK